MELSSSTKQFIKEFDEFANFFYEGVRDKLQEVAVEFHPIFEEYKKEYNIHAPFSQLFHHVIRYSLNNLEDDLILIHNTLENINITDDNISDEITDLIIDYSREIRKT